mmetsp:Transcript_28906/g.52900  ORF Transcript_28906/g.52900 Transcript_28906/m.52900 type:complete len:256 (-) Transcript_28906:539-1306(-)
MQGYGTYRTLDYTISQSIILLCQLSLSLSLSLCRIRSVCQSSRDGSYTLGRVRLFFNDLLFGKGGDNVYRSRQGATFLNRQPSSFHPEILDFLAGAQCRPRKTRGLSQGEKKTGEVTVACVFRKKKNCRGMANLSLSSANKKLVRRGASARMYALGDFFGGDERLIGEGDRTTLFLSDGNDVKTGCAWGIRGAFVGGEPRAIVVRIFLRRKEIFWNVRPPPFRIWRVRAGLFRSPPRWCWIVAWTFFRDARKRDT